MAEGGDEKKSGGGGGEDNAKSEFPPGFRFAPTSEQLVKYYLLPRLRGRPPVPNDAIIEDYVYQCHPNKLIAKYKDRGEDSWYFLSPRARKYDNGDRPSRHTDDGLGRWKASTGKAEADEAVGDGGTKFCKTVLAYFNGPVKEEKKTRWLMHELTIPEYEKKIGRSGSNKKSSLDDYVMCKIYVTPRKNGKINDDEAGPSGECQEACPPVSDPGPVESGQGTAGPKLPEKQAGKRRLEESPCGAASTPERALQRNLHLGPPAPLHGGGMQGDPFRTAARYYGGPMAYNARTPMQRLPVVYNGQAPVAYNGQVPVQQQLVACNGLAPVAFNGQVPVQQQLVAYNGQQVPVQRQPLAFNGQVPIQQQLVAYNGQQVPVQWQPFAFNGQVRPPGLGLSPPYRTATAPNSCGQSQAMMRRPSYPSGQAVKPPSVSRPQKREQPETEEMRAHRVLRQHLEEFESMKKEQPTAFPPQPPYFGAGVNNHHARAMAPQFPTYNFYTREAGQQSQFSWAVPAVSGSSGAAAPASPEASVPGAGNEESGECDFSNDDEKKFVELATMKTSPGGSPWADGDAPKND